jgi:serine phosphatase RsbU (regulator of sigma subunit)/anti-sigma regulatory factor (Ser/Thr protein kinase)
MKKKTEQALKRKKEKFKERPSAKTEEGLSFAQNFQAAMIPKRLPATEGLEMASLYLPSSEVGGDLFNVIHLTEDLIALFMFDVAHHGVSAALISAMAKVSFDEHIRSLKSPKQVMQRVNAQLKKNISADYYLTAIVAYLDLHDNKLTYCNAGHAYPILYKKTEKTIEQLGSTGVFLGIMENGYYEEKCLYCNPGDWLFLFTDGIYRMFHAENELTGRRLLEKEILNRLDGLSPVDFTNRLRKRYLRRNPGKDPEDDIIIISVEFLTQSRKIQSKEKLGFQQNDPVYFQFISYFEEMDRAVAVILSSMDSLGYPDESIRKMKIVLIELLANSIDHGNKKDHLKKVTIGHIIDDNKAVISVLDEGNGFDPKNIPDPTLPENLVKDSGRGLYIVKNYVDKLEFNTAGNRVTVTKNFIHKAEKQFSG